MKGQIEERTIQFANHIIDTKATIRDTARQFGISKSTVHKDITERLKKLNVQLYEETRKVLEENKSIRHIRGGIATKNKYLNQQKTK